MNPMSSAAHDAITALVEVTREALPESQVLDGPAAEELENDTIVIGVGDPAVMTTRTDPDFGGRCTETGEIVCVISCWDGETDVAAKRKRVIDLLGVLEAALRDNPRMVTPSYPDGAVDDSILGGVGELVQRQQAGALVALGFSVRYEAHI